ncbi:MAG: hypothetical protein AAFS13_09180, partial [Pseudomonadota bacterium]
IWWLAARARSHTYGLYTDDLFPSVIIGSELAASCTCSDRMIFKDMSRTTQIGNSNVTNKDLIYTL